MLLGQKKVVDMMNQLLSVAKNQVTTMVFYKTWWFSHVSDPFSTLIICFTIVFSALVSHLERAQSFQSQRPKAICINSSEHDTLLVIIPFISHTYRVSKQNLEFIKKGLLNCFKSETKGSRTLSSEFHGKIQLF